MLQQMMFIRTTGRRNGRVFRMFSAPIPQTSSVPDMQISSILEEQFIAIKLPAQTKEEALNSMIDIHSIRVAVALQARIPGGIWIALLSLTFLGMVAVGYQMGIAGSKRSLAQSILALSFSLVITLIASLDRPGSGYVTVSQQPMVSLRNSMEADVKQP